jgi:hypothetical protein
MAKLGLNVKLTIPEDYKSRVRAVFSNLNATATQPMPGLEVYRLDDGANVGVFYADSGKALSPDDQRKGAWLEFAVRDPETTAERMLAMGIARIEYSDKTHAYFQIPGGPVFRLAREA